MSLREEMARYEKLTGESAEHIPIIKIGAYLDGVDKGIEELEKIKAEIKEKYNMTMSGYRGGLSNAISIINAHISELKGDTEKKYEAKAITRGNCMICGKELTDGLFFCKECEGKANSEKENKE